jgi:DNA-binding XRE family transcriptional regulator/Uma2 family endonuclease
MNNRLRTLRTERNLSQANLAELLEVSRQTINALETGKSDPSLPLAFKIAQLFNCPVEKIFFLEQKSMFARRFCHDHSHDHSFSFDGLSEKAQEVLRLAQNESRRLRHNFVGTEQILLGLIAERTSFAAQLLQSMGVNLWNAQAEVQKIIGYGFTLVDRQVVLTPRAKRVVRLAKEAASRLGDNEVGTEHLLLGLIREKGGVSAIALKNLGVNIETLEQQLLEQLQQTSIDQEESPKNTTTNQFNWNAGKGSSKMEQPSDLASAEISVRLGAILLTWVEPRQLGRVVHQAGFGLPNGDVVVPRLAFISRERLQRIPRTYPEVIPELIIEIKSAFDRVSVLEEKIQLFLEQGARVGLLIDPDQQTIAIYRHGSDLMLLSNEHNLTISEIFPEWEIPISQIWPPVFE